jgi:hypothetical protein
VEAVEHEAEVRRQAWGEAAAGSQTNRSALLVEERCPCWPFSAQMPLL